jgi:hypothetical protein
MQIPVAIFATTNPLPVASQFVRTPSLRRNLYLKYASVA